jgi:tungstate transport system substrate-binding protein
MRATSPARLAAAVLLTLALGCARSEPERTAPAAPATPPAPPAAKAAPASAPAAARSLILATTTSTQDTGLLDVLLPKFEASHHIKVKAIAVGTGEALAMGRRGDADVLLVHARAAEDAFMAEGLGSLRLDVMHNDFLLVGPAADPAHAKGKDAAAALAAIHKARAVFVSRGDHSGTHTKELRLWKAAGITPAVGPTYLSAGQGMGATLRIASEKHAYCLVDRGTYLALRKGLGLVPIVEGDPRLFNPYGVIVVNPARFPRVKGAAAMTFARWLVGPEAQGLIGGFGVDRFGQRLFVPDAKAPGAAPAPAARPAAPAPGAAPAPAARPAAPAPGAAPAPAARPAAPAAPR